MKKLFTLFTILVLLLTCCQSIREAAPCHNEVISSINGESVILRLKDGSTRAFDIPGSLVSFSVSPDNCFLAANIREANFGDYLWVYSLEDGSIYRQPDDAKLSIHEIAAADSIYKEYKYFITAINWNKKGLVVKRLALYEDCHEYLEEVSTFYLNINEKQFSKVAFSSRMLPRGRAFR